MITGDIFSTLIAATSHVDGVAASGVEMNNALDYNVSLGNLLQIGAFIVFITIFIVNSRGAAKILATRLEIVDASMEDFRKELKEFSKVLISQVQQDGQIQLLAQQFVQQGQRVDEISRSLGDFKNMVLQDTLKRSA